MQGKTFIDGIKTPFDGAIDSREVNSRTEGKRKLTYMNWARSCALAGLPMQRVDAFDGRPYMDVFGGAVVSVSERLPSGTWQPTFLPVLDGRNAAVEIGTLNSRDIADAISRCRAKAVAAVNGVGLPLFSNGQTDTRAFLNALHVKPDSDLLHTEALARTAKQKNGAYVDWPTAIAAVRITDPDFAWDVLWFEVIDPATGEVAQRPYLRVPSSLVDAAGTPLSTWCVAVKVRYKGDEHIEWLSIMGHMPVQTRNGTKMLDHRPLVNPTAHDWNRAVMRCLVKAIAMASGYGIAVYAHDELSDLDVEPIGRRPASNDDASAATGSTAQPQAAPAAPAEAAAPAPVPAQATPADGPPGQTNAPLTAEQRSIMVGQVEATLRAGGRTPEALIAHLHASAKALTDLTDQELTRAVHVRIPTAPPANRQVA